MKSLPLRPNVCMLLFNSEKKLWLGEREGEPGRWQFPQGGIEPELSPEENVIKELCEELGVEPRHLKIDKKLKATNEYDFRKVPDYAKDRWRGQSQTFWLVRYLGGDADIDIGKYTPEFMNWRWCTVNEVEHIAEPVRLKGYQAALEEFKDFCRSERS